LSSDGVLRKQLIKGKDDLRQDAVMQQFFQTVNKIITYNNSKAKCKLNTLRCYKIVPLSQKSGILEWVDGTITIGDWLVGNDVKSGAHFRYEPDNWRIDQCKKLLHVGVTKATIKANLTTKEDIYNEICKHLKPVMRYFFMETYSTPSEWFVKRLNYMRSVATSSIVGYIVGLGDRHTQNILIDKITADIVHIDLGIAFDQGKILPTPETVPFRLTRDIVDGFGINGIEGIFKECCERTLDLLKNSSDQIMTIFEVLLYDPLHNWSISPKKAYELQQIKNNDFESDDSLSKNKQDSSIISTDFNFNQSLNHSECESTTSTETTTKTNRIAERILFQLKQKLHGVENGVQLSTKGQVNYLINEATNPANLCRLYAGWQPYL
jgi:serine-protein kinase ATM